MLTPNGLSYRGQLGTLLARERNSPMNQRPYRLLSAMVVLSMIVSGCATNGGGPVGLISSASQTRGSGVYLQALQGGIIARSGVKLSNSERQRALEAEYRALEASPGGQPITWAGGDVNGEVVAAAPYQVGSQNCRQYTHKVYANGAETVARGAACRNKDGTWTPLT